MTEEKREASAPEQAQRLATGEINDAEAVAQKAHLDFLTALILIFVSVATIITSITYWQKQRCLFYESAGFMPTIIGGALLIMGIRLLIESLRFDSVRGFIKRLGEAAVRTVKSERVHKSVIGLIFFGTYVFALLGNMPFWLCSFITLAAVLEFVHFDKTWQTALKMLIIAALAVAGIVALFQYAFSVPMP